MRPTASDLVRLLDLRPLPIEGGLFRQTWRGPVNTAGKPAGTCIYVMYTQDPDSFSAMHRLPKDEIWHFYLGDPLFLLLLFPDGASRRVILGSDVLAGQHVQFIVPAGTWMGACMAHGGEYALAGCTMAVGFTDDDYVGGARDELIAQYPDDADCISQLTRLDAPVVRMPESL
jgi:uncharacterized protein